jgi:methyltransferase (TIGR00027 family)
MAAKTASGVLQLAAIEQHESSRRRLFSDDLAVRLLPMAVRLPIALTAFTPLRRLLNRSAERRGPGWAMILCRKRYIDDQFAAHADQYGQIVNLGAGLDTRGLRWASESRPVFEVDQPANVETKRHTIEKAFGVVPPQLHLIPMDFESGDLNTELARHGYNPACRTFFIWERVTQYLTECGFHATLAFLRAASPGSRIVFTYVHRDFIDGIDTFGARQLYEQYRARQQVWLFGLRPNEVEAILNDHGWRVVEHVGAGEYQRRYVDPTGRRLVASGLERAVCAEKTP